ncbi:MAG: 8-amino-7-oxononanoate synthase [Pseudomonadales bacterium]|nr:8-amino-7-oxononanoate synthase [Pseudomonadales bacterium]MCP5337071.1 8-amino-7-oxononanoate synthase [Pseudomonadales bacterium]
MARTYADLAERLAAREAAGLYRRRRVVDVATAPLVRVDGRELLAFCSNDYLGLANDPRVIAAFCEGARRYGVGSGASHLVCGHTPAHHALEEELARFTGRERALLFGSGYAANLGVAAALLARGDVALQDRLNHASLLDGALLSGARPQRFRHNDVEDLERRLARVQGARRVFVAVDGVFSMDGDEAPLASLAAACTRHGALLCVDDAHGFGVLGERGAGSLEKHAVGAAEVPLLMATLGKALGVAGAFVAGSAQLIETLIQFARTYIYTTAMPPALACAVTESLRIVADEPWRRVHLQRLVERFRAGAGALGLSLLPSASAIQPLLVGAAGDALRIADRLDADGLLVPAIRPPTVPQGQARLRVTLSAAHSEAQVDRLLDALARAGLA